MVFTRRLRCGREEKRREEKRREEKRREVFCRPYAYQLRISKIKLLKRLLINAKYFIRFVLPGYDFFVKECIYFLKFRPTGINPALPIVLKWKFELLPHCCQNAVRTPSNTARNALWECRQTCANDVCPIPKVPNCVDMVLPFGKMCAAIDTETAKSAYNLIHRNYEQSV